MALCDLLQQLEGLSPTELDAVAAIAAAKARDLQSCIVASRKLRGAPPDIASIQARADATKGPAVAFLATRSSERRQAQDAEAAARSTVVGAEGLEWAALEEAAYRVQRTAAYATNVALLWHHGLALRSLSDEEGHRAALREAEAAQRADIFTSVVATVAAATATEAVALFQERETVDRVALEEAWAVEQGAVATAEQRSFWACRLTSVQDEEVAQRMATERAMGAAVDTLRQDDEVGRAAVGALEALRCLIAAEGTAREECRSAETSASDSLHTEWCLTRSHLADVGAQTLLSGEERAARANITSAFDLDCSNLCCSAEDLTRRGVVDDESSGRVALVAVAKQLQLMTNEERDRLRCLQEWEAPLGPWRTVACSVEEEDHLRDALSEAESREWTLVARCGHSLADTNRDAVEAQVALALEEGNLRDSLDVAEDRDRSDVAAAEQQVRVDVAETVARADLLRSEGVAVESVVSQRRAERAAHASLLHVAEREDLCAGEAAAREAIIEARANEGGELLGNAGWHRVLVRCAEAEGLARADLLSVAEATLGDNIAAARAGARDIEGCLAAAREESTARDGLHREEAVAAGVLFHDALDAEERCHVVDDAVVGALQVERSERDGRADIVAFMAEEKRQIQVSIEAERRAAEKAVEEARIEAERIEAERRAAEKAVEEARIEAERIEAERIEAERIEAERKAAEEEAAEEARIEAERIEAERIEAERKAAEEARIEAERKAAEEKEARIEAERKAAERKAAEEARIEAERIEAERIEAERIEAERKAAEEARIEAERIEAERIEAERKAAEEARIEAERKAAEEKEARIEAERKAAERKAAEEARIEAERKAAEEKEARIEAERIEAERIEAERKAAEEKAAEEARIDAERKAAEEKEARIEAERKAAEEKEARIEAERIEAERIEAERIEAERKAAEEARIEAERIEAERIEAERIEAERKAAEEKAAEEKAAEEARIEAERIEAERKAAEEKAAEEARIEAERIEAERKAAEEKAAEEARIEAERIEAERKAAEEKAAEEARIEAERIEAERKAAEEKAAEEARRKAEEKDKVPLSDLIRRVPTQMVPAFKMRRNALFKLFDPAATNAVAQADAERCVAEVLQLTIPAPVIQAAFTQSCAAAHGEDSPMTRGSFRLFLLCLRRYLEVADVCPGPADPDAFRAIAAAMAAWPVPVPSPDAAFAKISAGAPRAPLLVVCRWAMAEQLAVDTALDDDSASPQRRATPSQEPSRPAFDEPPFTKGGMLQNFGKKAFFRSFKPFFVVCEPDRIAWFKSEADYDRKAAPVDSVPLFTVTTNSRGSHFKTPAVCQPVLVDGDCSKATDAKTAYFAVDWVLPNGDTEKLVLGAPSVRERQDWVRFITRYIPRCIPPGCVDAEAISRMPVGSDPPKHRREATGGEAPGTRQK